MTIRLGADGTSSDVAALQGLGATFISRYTSEQSWALTPDEAQRDSDAGIDLVSNYEHYTNDIGGGFSQGVTNAHTGLRVATNCGMPGDRPIYFSVDEDVDPNNSSLHSYFQGAGSVLSANRVGVYGSTAVCDALFAAGLVTWKWRTMSTGWRGGAGSPSDFNVEQTGYFNSTYDRDASITDDFGQWRVNWSPATNPPPPTGVVVYLQEVIWAAKADPGRPQGGTTSFADVYPVEQALKGEGLLNPLYASDGSYGSLTVTAYAAWQRSLGFTGADADGIPGMYSLTKLGQKYGFTVIAGPRP